MLYFNLLSLVALIFGASVFAVQAMSIAAAARVYPLVLIVLVVVISIAVGVKEWTGRAHTPRLDAELARIFAATASRRLRLLVFVITWGAYPVLLSYAGFIVATTLALSVSLWTLRIRRLYLGVLGAAIFSVVFAVLFATVLYIPTPSGVLDQLLIQAIYAINH